MDFDFEKYKNYPEGSGGKKMYDEFTLTFDAYLIKYYSCPDFEEWNRWRVRFIEPAFDENRHDEMIRNFGYVSKDRHDFDCQSFVYAELQQNKFMAEDVKQFVGFMAGAGFFKKYKLSIQDWLEIRNWFNPIESNEMKPISEIIAIPYGLNYLRLFLLQMPFWRR